jgi:FkbM family methyltransferase
MIRQFGTKLVASIEKVVGRRHLVRGSRFALDYARRDVPNQMATNGETMVQDVVIAATASDCLVVFDVGANIGDWSRRLLTAARERGRQTQVHAFEPAAATFAELIANLLPAFEGSVVPVQSAASDHNGDATLFKIHELAGSNSIHGIRGSTEGLTPETINLWTLDDYCRSVGIETIDLLKIDAEGHDHLVLSGARTLLARGAIEVIQFEYNHRWIGARRYLKDVFDDLVPLGYEIGKVTPDGIEWYPTWSEELETFREGNYLASRPESRRRFPAIRWWLDA